MIFGSTNTGAHLHSFHNTQLYREWNADAAKVYQSNLNLIYILMFYVIFNL